MNIRNSRLRTFAALATLTTLGCSTVQAGQVRGTENQLLGITLRNSTFREVLKKYGQPDEVQGGGPFLPTPPKEAAAPAGGMASRSSYPSGGMPGSGGGPSSGGGMPGQGGAGGGSKRLPSRSGFPGKNDGVPAAGGGGTSGGPGAGGYPGAGGGSGSSGYPGAGGGPGSSGPSGGYPGTGQSGGYPGGGYPGASGGPGSSGGKGLPGFPGGAEGPGAGASGLPGGAGESGGGGSDQAEPPVTEATWWYHNPRKGYHMSFLFNKEGRVIQIQEYGNTSLHAGKTRQGIVLGSNMTQVLSRYGWSNDGAHDGDNVIMRYGGANKVAFQMVRNRVLGITVAVGR